MFKYSLFDCPRVLVICVIYEYNFMIARPFIFVVMSMCLVYFYVLLMESCVVATILDGKV